MQRPAGRLPLRASGPGGSGLPGAEAVLRLRALVANGDLDSYWRFHSASEHERLNPTPDQQDFNLTA
ncbi:hypothetical protein ACIPJK_36915 [Streptomyces roseus]|uniref:hypothetical protein n=1 Tax=Streptomyces roseus TaxID=66430 RepID=UPI003801320A